MRVTSDVIALNRGNIVLVKRKNWPYGLALPGGLVDEGESLEETAKRELFEETGLEASEIRQFGTYSAPNRDPRGRYITTVFVCETIGEPKAASDARDICLVSPKDLKGMSAEDFAFDHYQILMDYLRENAGTGI